MKRWRPPLIEDEKALDRVVFFSDAVFAIAMTLLGVELRVPLVRAGLTLHEENRELAHALAGLGNELYSFALTFFVLGTFWMAHHRKFRLIRRYDDRLLWLNLGFLFFVAFVPFPTAVLGRYGDQVATIFYASSMAVTALLALSITVYAYARHRLIDANVDDREIRHWIRRASVGPVVFLVSVPLALLSTRAAQASWLLIFAGTFLLGRVYRRNGSPDWEEG